jgi:hypothetical protein
VKQDAAVKKQRKRKVGKPKKKTPVAKREFPPQTVTLLPQAAARESVEETAALPPAPMPGHRRLWRWLGGCRLRHLEGDGLAHAALRSIAVATRAAAMVPQIGGIGRPCMEAGVGWLRDELTDIPRTLRPM